MIATLSSIAGREKPTEIVSAICPSKIIWSKVIWSSTPVEAFDSSIAARRVHEGTEVLHPSEPGLASSWSPVLLTM